MVRKPPTSIHWRPPCTPCSSAARHSSTIIPRSQSELISLIVNQPLPRLNRPDVPADVEAVLRRALNKDPDQRYYSALEFARAMQRVQFAYFGHATPVTVEGMPAYPKDIERRRRATDQRDQITRSSRRWVKPVGITVGILAAITAAALIFAFVVVPRMDSATGSDTKQVATPGTKDDDNNRNNQDDVITDTANAQIPSPENLNGTYAADGSSVTFTWTNPDPQSGDTYAWAIVQGSNTDQSAQTVTTSDPTVTVNAQEGSQTCIQVSIVRKNRQNDPLATAGHATLALRIASDVRPAAANSPNGQQERQVLEP